MKNHKPAVAHINRLFFAGPETFIYHYISNLKSFHPICLAWGFIGHEQFPFPREDLYLTSFKRYTLEWFWATAARKCFGRELCAGEVLRKRNVRLIHAHFGPCGVYGLKLKRASGIPLITTFYGYDMSQLVRIKKWEKEYKSLFKEGDLFLVEGPHMKSCLIALGCPEEKIKIQRIAIPLDRIPFRPRGPKKQDEKTVIVFAGRFREKKGLIYALEALRKVREKYKNFEYRIIGDGPLKTEVEEFVETHRMKDYVRMLGFLSYEDYLKEMQGADIFLHPSITASDGETEGGAPTTILEAQAMGMPIVSSYHADIPNVVVPGKSALLCDEKDCVGIYKNVSHLLENPHSWEDMGRVGREFVEKYHDIKNEVIELESKYSHLLQEGCL